MDVNVLITHTPPYKMFDRVKHNMHLGCKDLFEKIKYLNQLELHMFGHIHENFGYRTKDGIIYANVGMANNSYNLKIDTPIEIIL